MPFVLKVTTCASTVEYSSQKWLSKLQDWKNDRCMKAVCTSLIECIYLLGCSVEQMQLQKILTCNWYIPAALSEPYLYSQLSGLIWDFLSLAFTKALSKMLPFDLDHQCICCEAIGLSHVCTSEAIVFHLDDEDELLSPSRCFSPSEPDPIPLYPIWAFFSACMWAECSCFVSCTGNNNIRGVSPCKTKLRCGCRQVPISPVVLILMSQ